VFEIQWSDFSLFTPEFAPFCRVLPLKGRWEPLISLIKLIFKRLEKSSSQPKRLALSFSEISQNQRNQWLSWPVKPPSFSLLGLLPNPHPAQRGFWCYKGT
jgi:hypothetical protein